MSRWESADNESAATAEHVRLVVLADLDFSSGMVRAHDGVGKLTFNGYDYTGLGEFVGLEEIDEGLDTVARGVTATLSGPSSVLTAALTENYQNREATFYIGLLAEDLTWIADPEELWSGRMDTLSIKLGEKSSSITLTCEHRLRREANVARFTDSDQQTAYTGDLFFSLMDKIPGYKSLWGDRPSSYLKPPQYIAPQDYGGLFF